MSAHGGSDSPRGATPSVRGERTYGEERILDLASERSPFPESRPSAPVVPDNPRPPEGLDSAGLALWHAVADDFDLDAHEVALLAEAARTVTTLARLDEIVRAEGEVIDSPQGRKAHPALVERRQTQITLARLLAALRMPQGDEEEGTQATARPKRKRGAIGVYDIKAPGRSA